MNENRKKLAGKTVLADQMATELYLDDRESLALQTGMAIYEGILKKVERANHGQLPAGAEDEAVEKANQIVPGFGNALEKWANGFKSILTSGRDN